METYNSLKTWQNLTKLEVYRLFSEVHKFPWNLAGISVPKTGATHSYLCRILAPYANRKHFGFLTGNPGWSELKTFVKNNDERLAVDIMTYCAPLYECYKWERNDIADEVLYFLSEYSPFVDDFSAKIIELHRQGLIEIKKR